MANGPNNRWERGVAAMPRTQSSNRNEPENWQGGANGDWHTVTRGRRSGRQQRGQFESESVKSWTRGQDVRERRRDDDAAQSGERSTQLLPSRDSTRQWQPQRQQSGTDDEPRSYRPPSSELRAERGGWYQRDANIRGRGFSRGGSGGGRGRGRGSWRGENEFPNDDRKNPHNDANEILGSSEFRGRGDNRRPGGERGRGGRGRGRGGRDQSWNFWTLLCGSDGSQLVFSQYKGFLNDYARESFNNGWIRVPLFQATTDEEICEKFREKMQSIAASVAECEELRSEACHLKVHMRVGDLYLFHRSFHFDSRPGPRLGDFSLLLEDRTVQQGSALLKRFFNDDEDVRQRQRKPIKSTFETEKSIENHATFENFLAMRGFEEVASSDERQIFTTSLNGQQKKFELMYNLEDMKMKTITLYKSKWNLNIVTAKGSNYQGSFREVADFRLQFDTSFVNNETDKVAETLHDEGFLETELQELFERIGELPPLETSAAGAPALWETPNHSYRVRNPHLGEKLEYIREQLNRTFVLRHNRWPFQVLLRQFKFYKFTNALEGQLIPQPGVELRVTAHLDCPLHREVLTEPEFVSHMWDCCRQLQDLVAASVDAELAVAH